MLTQQISFLPTAVNKIILKDNNPELEDQVLKQMGRKGREERRKEEKKEMWGKERE